jgi:hypothetical protein
MEVGGAVAVHANDLRFYCAVGLPTNHKRYLDCLRLTRVCSNCLLECTHCPFN